MNPNDIPQWLAEHGGADGPPQTAANGVVTHRARDGSYVNVFNGRVTMIGHGASSAEPTDAAPAQPAQRPGGGMDQQQVEAWIAANGGAAGLQYNSASKTIDNPAADPTTAAAAGVPFNPLAPPKITIAEESWTNTKTGAVLRVSRQPDGAFQVIENRQADPNKPAERATDKPTIGRVEGTPMPDGTFDNTKPIWVERDPVTGQQVGPAKPLTQQQREQWERDKNGGLTDAEVRARNSPENQVGKPTGNTRKKTENGKTVTETEYLLPDGTKEWRTQEETAPPDRVGKPTGNTRERNEGGKQIKETEYILPDGTKEWRVQEAPSTANRTLPANMPPFRPDPNLAGLGLVDYVQGLTALRSQRRPDGTPMLTEAEFTQLVSLAHQQASTEAQRLDTITRAQQQQQANEISQRNSDMQLSSNRLTAANSATQNALDTSLKMAGNFTNDTYRSAGGPILPAVMALQDMRAASWGGMNTPPPVTTAGYPALQQVGQMGLTPQQQQNTVIPAVAALANGGGAGAPPAAPAAAAARPPLFAPRTNMPTPNPPQPVGTPPVRDDWRTAPQPGQAVSDPRDAGGYSGPPMAPVQPVPTQGDPFVGGSVLPQPPDQMPVPVPYPTSPGAVSMQQPGILPAVNTLGLAAEVAAAGGYSPEVMQMAQRELGWL